MTWDHDGYGPAHMLRDMSTRTVGGRIFVRASVAWFAEWMEAKLSKKDPEHPDGWVGTPPHDLLVHLQSEVVELTEALNDVCIPGNTSLTITNDQQIDHLIDECSDVANIAHMLADIAERSRRR
jgi:NTP pyrophosphatase (non-canonical NTP hydrolase)